MSSLDIENARRIVENFDQYLKKYCSADNPRIRVGNHVLLDAGVKVYMLGLDSFSENLSNSLKKFSNTRWKTEKEDTGGLTVYAIIPLSYAEEYSDEEDYRHKSSRGRASKRVAHRRKNTEIFSMFNITLLIVCLFAVWSAVNQVRAIMYE